MARPRKHLAVAVAVLALSVGASAAYAAWSATTSTPTNSFTSEADWVPPAVSSAIVAKTTGYLAGAVRSGGTYYVYANVSDSGNPASGINATNGVTTNSSTLTTGATAVALASGSFSAEGTGYNYRTASQTVGAAITAGSKAWTLATKDSVPNTLSPAFTSTVTVDNTSPSGSDVQAVNKGATVGKAEQGDTIVYTFNEAIDPASIISGWTGASTTLTVRGINGGGQNDSIQYWTATTGGTQISTLGTFTFGAKTYFTGTVNYGNSTIALPSPYTTLTVTLGTPDAPGSVGTGAAGTIAWGPSTSTYDRAGNPGSSTAVNESNGGSTDAEF